MGNENQTKKINLMINRLKKIQKLDVLGVVSMVIEKGMQAVKLDLTIGMKAAHPSS